MSTKLGVTGTPLTNLEADGILVNSFICISGVWKNITEIYICIGGVWKSITEVDICISSTWETTI